MIRLSREESFLLLSCRPQIDADGDAHLKNLVNPPLDWPFILWRAETYQTLPLIGYHLQRLELGDAVPEWVRVYVSNWSAVSQARSVEQFRQLGEIINLLQGLGIDYFLFKGAVLAVSLYPDPLLRPMQDLDIMIRPRDAWKVQKAIYRIGYRHGVFNPEDGKFTHLFRKITRRSLQNKYALHSVTKTTRVIAPCPSQQIPFSWRKRQIKSFVHEDGTMTIPIFVDFHVNLATGMDEADVWRGAVTRSLLGEDVTAQSPTALLWFSAARLYYEAFQHATLKLQMFGDIDGLLRTFEDAINWAELITVAKKYEFDAALYFVLEQARRLNHSPVPKNVTSLLEPSKGEIPNTNDWGDVMAKILSRPVVNEFELA